MRVVDASGARLLTRREEDVVRLLVRWPGVLSLGPLASYGFALLFPIAGALYDRWSRRRVHLVYWWGRAVIMLGVAVRVALLGSLAWMVRHAVAVRLACTVPLPRLFGATKAALAVKVCTA